MKFRLIIPLLFNQPYQRWKLTIMEVKRNSCVSIQTMHNDANENIEKKLHEIDKMETDATQVYFTYEDM